MASTIRLGALAGRAPSLPSYVCLQCRLHISTALRKSDVSFLSYPSARRHASNNPFTERLRKKIWGSETLPGPEDPYSAPGIPEQRRREKEEAREQEKGLAKTDSPTMPAENEESQDSTIEEEDGEGNDSSTWEGMTTVGGPDYGMDRWDEEHPFRGYLANPRPESREEIVAIIHRALVEVMTLKAANLPLVISSQAYDPTEDYTERIANGARFKEGTGGHMELVLESEELRQSILECVNSNGPHLEEEDLLDEENWEDEQLEEEMEVTTGDQIPSPEMELREQLELEAPSETEISEVPSADEDLALVETEESSYSTVPVDDSWRTVSLADSEFKFAVLKRVMQMTGKRIPDPDIESIKDPRALLIHLVKKPKPKKLAQNLFANEVADLPNVQILDRRYSYIHREKEIGRWKVIERELEARGLPVIGKGVVRRGDALI